MKMKTEEAIKKLIRKLKENKRIIENAKSIGSANKIIQGRVKALYQLYYPLRTKIQQKTNLPNWNNVYPTAIEGGASNITLNAINMAVVDAQGILTVVGDDELEEFIKSIPKQGSYLDSGFDEFLQRRDPEEDLRRGQALAAIEKQGYYKAKREMLGEESKSNEGLPKEDETKRIEQISWGNIEESFDNAPTQRKFMSLYILSNGLLEFDECTGYDKLCNTLRVDNNSHGKKYVRSIEKAVNRKFKRLKIKLYFKGCRPGFALKIRQ